MLRRDRKRGGPAFRVAVDQDNVVLTLSHGEQSIKTSDWGKVQPASAYGLGLIREAFEEDRRGGDGTPLVLINDTNVRLSPEFVASLDGATADRLGFPPNSPLGLELKPQGRIDEDGFHLVTRWIRPGGLPVRAKVAGALLTTDSGLHRIPSPMWRLYRAALDMSAPLPKAIRFEKLTALKELWPGEPDFPLESQGYLQDLRVHYATSTSLKIKALTPSQTEFDPILFGARELADAENANRPLDEEFDSILAPASQKVFAEERFKRERDVRPVYVLRDGEYVFIDPSLRPALQVIRDVQAGPESVRREFVLNPRRALREKLGDDSAATDLDRLFVESEQFSSRVSGVDVWRTPVLPWLMPLGKNKWLPERFGVRVGEQYYAVPPKNVTAVASSVRAAAAAGEPTADVTGLLETVEAGGPPPPTHLPANTNTLRAVESLEPLAANLSGEQIDARDPAAWDSKVLGKLFLLVRDNFEEVEYAPIATTAEGSDRQHSAAVTPGILKTSLKKHQVEGFAWLAECFARRQPGALLADDMGLGKTVQAIAFMAWLQQRSEQSFDRAPFLVVAPTGLLGTWRNEIEKHLSAPRLGAIVSAFGSNLRSLREDERLSAKDIETGRAALTSDAWRDAGVVLTTYETLRDYHFSFARTRFGLIVFDEIQKLKNPVSQVTRSAKALNGAFILGMTGTPVENRLQDLWSIMDVVLPGYLGASRDFEKRHPSHDRVALGALKRKLTEATDGRPPAMLRRLKSDVLQDLPRKHVHRFKTEMPPVQANAYRDLVVRAAASASAGTLGKGGMLSTLAEMRGISLHPLDPRQAPSDATAYAADSARLTKTLALLSEIATKSEKAIVVVEDLAMQERLAGMVQMQFGLPTTPMRINGSVPGLRRQEIVDKFELNHNQFDVIILSPKAGGVGLTVTSANHVIHLSRWWNPAVEDQATDRVHRIGQNREVHVYLPMAIHPDPAIHDSSFDLRLDALIERKRQLTRDLFLPPDSTDDDLSELFREVSLAVAPSTASDKTEDVARQTEQETNEHEKSRPLLSLPAALAQSGIRRWRRDAGQPRPTEEIMAIFANRHIVRCTIRDPYALSTSKARQAQIEFLALLKSASGGLEAVTVEYAPDVESDRDEGFQRREFGSLFSSSVSGSGTPSLNLTRREKRSRSRDDDFHDRFVELDIRHGGSSVRRHELTIGRGLEALFDMRKQCTATYAPPSQGND